MKTLITALALFAATTPLTAFAEDIDTPIGQEIVSYNDAYNGIAERHDLEAFVALYNDNPLWIAPTEAPVAGLDVPRGTFGFIKKHEGKLTHTADHVFVSKDGTQAVLIGRYDVAIEAVGNEASGTYLFVLKRESEDGEWDLVVDMFNEHKPS